MKKSTTTENTSYETYGIEIKNIAPRVILIFSFIFFFVIFLASCGAKKIDQRHEEKEVKTETINIVKNDVQINKDVQTLTKVFINDSVKEEIEEIENVNVDGSKTIKRKIKRNKAIKTESNTNTQLNEKTTDKTNKNTLQSKQTKESIKTKNIDKKQYGILEFCKDNCFWIWIILLVILFILRKYKDKLLGIFKKT